MDAGNRGLELLGQDEMDRVVGTTPTNRFFV